MFKKVFVVSICILTAFLLVSNVSATTYGISNSTDVDTISKMVSGDIPIKNNKFIKNGDVVKFKEGNYNNLNLIVKKGITITSVKKAKVKFIGNNSGIGIKLINKKKKININGIRLKNYHYGIYGKSKSGNISKNIFYKNEKYGIFIRGTKLIISKNKFIQNADGLYLVGNNNIISHNNAKRGEKYSYVLFIRGNNNLITKNKFKTPNSYPIYIEGNKNKITKNTINKAISGIYAGGRKNLISYNKIYNIPNTEAICVFGDKSIIEYNTAKNSRSGIAIIGKNNLVSSNKLYKNKIGIEYIKGNKLSKNKFIKNIRKTKLLKLKDLGEI